MSQVALDRILEHVVGQCYLRDPNISLYLNLTFMLMVLTRRSNGSTNSGLNQICKYFGTLCRKLE